MSEATNSTALSLLYSGRILYLNAIDSLLRRARVTGKDVNNELAAALIALDDIDEYVKEHVEQMEKHIDSQQASGEK